MARTTYRKTEANRAAIYARVSDKSQDTEEKTSISEQIGEMEAYCEGKGLTITARYQEVGRGWSKKRPEFQRMLADARKGRFDTIVCWKSDRLSRGMYPAAALMEVVEAHQIRLEAVMDAIDMKTFGLMAAIGKIELDNFRERSTMGKRGTAKQGRVPTGGLPYGYRIGDDGRPGVVEEQAEVVRRIFHMYVHEGMGSPSIAVRLTDEGIPTQTGKSLWRQSYIHYVLANATYTGTWVYGKERHISTEDGTKSYDQPRDTWIEVPVPPLVDEETWERAQALKKQRSRRARRNTKVLYMLQHLLKCGECGHNFHAKSTWRTTNVRNGKKYRYDLPTPRRYYLCNGQHSMRLHCRERPSIRAERLEGPIWSEVKRVIQNPDLIVAGIDTFDAQGGGSLEDEIAQAQRDLRSIQMEEDRAIRLFVSAKITEAQLDLQRKFITERLESARAKLDDYLARESSGAEKRRLMETVLAWARNVGQGIDELTDEERKEILQIIVEKVVIDSENNVDITLIIPIDDDSLEPDSPVPDSPEPESVAIASNKYWSGSSPASPASASTPSPSSPCSGARASGSSPSPSTPTTPPPASCLEAIIESVDEFYSENLAQEVTRGMREAASRGFWVSSHAPYGYNRGHGAGRGQEAPHPGTRPGCRLPRRQAHLRHGGGRKRDARTSPAPSTTRASPAPGESSGPRPASTTSSPTRLYTGTLVWGANAKDNAEPVRVEKAFPAIITKAQFNRVGKLMRSRAPKRSPTPEGSEAPTCSAVWSSARRATGRSAARTPRAASSPTTSASRLIKRGRTPATLPGSTPAASRSWSSARFAPTSSPRGTSPSW